MTICQIIAALIESYRRAELGIQSDYALARGGPA